LVSHSLFGDLELQAPGECQQVRAYSGTQRTASFVVPDTGDSGTIVGDFSMMDIPVVNELREIRRQLAVQCGNDAHRYAAMLQELSRTLPGVYVKQPLLPPQDPIAEEIVHK
jgi:hypothetical protein